MLQPGEQWDSFAYRLLKEISNMCLYIDNTLTSVLKASKTKEIKVYKVLIRQKEGLFGPYYPMLYEPGVSVSSRCGGPALTSEEIRKETVHIGIHVCLTYEGAEKIAEHIHQLRSLFDKPNETLSDSVVIEATANIDDLIAAGDWEDAIRFSVKVAAFNTVSITKESYDKAVKYIRPSQRNLKLPEEVT